MSDSGTFDHVCPTGFAETLSETVQISGTGHHVTTARGCEVSRTNLRRRIWVELAPQLVVVIDMEVMDVVRPLFSSGKARRNQCYTYLDAHPHMDVQGHRVPLLCYGEHFFLVGKLLAPDVGHNLMELLVQGSHGVDSVVVALTDADASTVEQPPFAEAEGWPLE